jgi:copper chaperone CopZ
MSKLIIIFLLSALCTFGKGETPDIEIKTKGLVCSSCGIGIKKHFGKLDSIKKVVIDEKKHMTYLFLNEDERISDKLIRATMEKAGYEAGKITRKTS